MIAIRRAAARGRTDWGWLDSRHTFSFGEYHDPAHMVAAGDQRRPGRRRRGLPGGGDAEVLLFDLG